MIINNFSKEKSQNKHYDIRLKLSYKHIHNINNINNLNI